MYLNNDDDNDQEDSDRIKGLSDKIENQLLDLEFLEREEKASLKTSESESPKINEQIKKCKAHIWEIKKSIVSIRTQRKLQNKQILNFEGIIFTVGFSPEPIILTIMNLKPKNVFFIATTNTESKLDKIVHECELKPSSYDKEIIKRKDDPAESYNAVKKGYHYLIYDKQIDQDLVALDPTGGTKMMSVGCGIFTSTRNINVVYVTSREYDERRRAPVPGSEEILMVEDPMKIYYDGSVLEALEFVAKGNYAAGFQKMVEADDKGRDPSKTEILRYWTLTLKTWDSLDYESAKNHLKHMMEKIDKYNEWPQIKCFGRDSLVFLEKICENFDESANEVSKLSPELIYDLYLNARRSFGFEHYDTAALKFYRIMEMVNQHLLWTTHGFNTSNPEFSESLRSDGRKVNVIEGLMDILGSIVPLADVVEHEIKHSLGSLTIDELLALYMKSYFEWKTRKKISAQSDDGLNQFKVAEFVQKPNNRSFPKRVALFNGILIRRALGLMICDLQSLYEIDGALVERNKSMLAHGFRPIDKKSAERIEHFCHGFLRDLCFYLENGKVTAFECSKKSPGMLKSLKNPFKQRQIKNLVAGVKERI